MCLCGSVYETVENEDGTKSQKLVKDGYYGWVEYDPDNKELNYTVSTTNGTLNIDYALLEGVVYYLQEKAAPDGYKVDSNIYVICDEESYQQMTAEKGVSSVINPATGVESAVVYMGAIKGGETLKSKLCQRKDSSEARSNPGSWGWRKPRRSWRRRFQFWRKEDNLCGTGDSHRRTGASGTAGGSAD